VHGRPTIANKLANEEDLIKSYYYYHHPIIFLISSHGAVSWMLKIIKNASAVSVEKQQQQRMPDSAAQSTASPDHVSAKMWLFLCSSNSINCLHNAFILNLACSKLLFILKKF
jgi:hypothetical protein